MKLGKQSISIGLLIRPNWLDTECRMFINESKVLQYVKEIKEGADFPPPVAFIDPADELIRVGDGFHRILAHKHNDMKRVEIDLKRGGRREAFLHGIETNREQRGLPFSLGDKEKCILMLFQDDETKKWTQTEIAAKVGCSAAYVSQVRTKHKSVIDRPGYTIDRNGIIRSQPISKDKEEVAKRKKETLQLFAKGIPKIEIARRLKIARWAVQQYIYDATNKKILTDCPHCNGTGKLVNAT